MSLFGWEKVSRNDSDYKTCVQVTTAVGVVAGMATGAPALAPGVLAGAAAGAFWGFVGGYLACPYLVPVLKRKLELGQPLTQVELKSAAEAMGKYANVKNASEAIKLVALTKTTKINAACSMSCSNPNQTAMLILKQA